VKRAGRNVLHYLGNVLDSALFARLRFRDAGSEEASGAVCRYIATDYNENSLFFRQADFLGADAPYAEYDAEGGN
jgi:hypothetical protein